MDNQSSGQASQEKSLESMVESLSAQLGISPEIIRHYLMHVYRELLEGAVIKDFIPIFVMRRVRDQFSAEKVKSKANENEDFLIERF